MGQEPGGLKQHIITSHSSMGYWVQLVVLAQSFSCTCRQWSTVSSAGTVTWLVFLTACHLGSKSEICDF